MLTAERRQSIYAMFPWFTEDDIVFFDSHAQTDKVPLHAITAARRLGRAVGKVVLKSEWPELTEDELWRIVMCWPPSTSSKRYGMASTPTQRDPYARMFKLAANLAGASFADLARLYGIRTSTVIKSVDSLMPASQRNTVKDLIPNRQKVDLPRLVEMKEYYYNFAPRIPVGEQLEPIEVARLLITCPTQLNTEGDEPSLEQQMFGGEEIKLLTRAEIEQVVAHAKSSLTDVEDDFKDDADY